MLPERTRAAPATRRVRSTGAGYGPCMSTEPHQPSSDEADPETQSTPAGLTPDLEEEAEDTNTSTDPPER